MRLGGEYGVLKAEAGRTGLGTSLTEAAQALNQHWLAQKGGLAVNQVVEQLVIGRRGEVKELLDGGLFSAGIPPPLLLKIQNPKL